MLTSNRHQVVDDDDNKVTPTEEDWENTIIPCM